MSLSNPTVFAFTALVLSIFSPSSAHGQLCSFPPQNVQAPDQQPLVGTTDDFGVISQPTLAAFLGDSIRFDESGEVTSIAIWGTFLDPVTGGNAAAPPGDHNLRVTIYRSSAFRPWAEPGDVPIFDQVVPTASMTTGQMLMGNVHTLDEYTYCITLPQAIKVVIGEVLFISVVNESAGNGNPNWLWTWGPNGSGDGVAKSGRTTIGKDLALGTNLAMLNPSRPAESCEEVAVTHQFNGRDKLITQAPIGGCQDPFCTGQWFEISSLTTAPIILSAVTIDNLPVSVTIYKGLCSEGSPIAFASNINIYGGGNPALLGSNIIAPGESCYVEVETDSAEGTLSIFTDPEADPCFGPTDAEWYAQPSNTNNIFGFTTPMCEVGTGSLHNHYGRTFDMSLGPLAGQTTVLSSIEVGIDVNQGNWAPVLVHVWLDGVPNPILTQHTFIPAGLNKELETILLDRPLTIPADAVVRISIETLENQGNNGGDEGRYLVIGANTNGDQPGFAEPELQSHSCNGFDFLPLTLWGAPGISMVINAGFNPIGPPGTLAWGQEFLMHNADGFFNPMTGEMEVTPIGPDVYRIQSEHGRHWGNGYGFRTDEWPTDAWMRTSTNYEAPDPCDTTSPAYQSSAVLIRTVTGYSVDAETGASATPDTYAWTGRLGEAVIASGTIDPATQNTNIGTMDDPNPGGGLNIFADTWIGGGGQVSEPRVLCNSIKFEVPVIFTPNGGAAIVIDSIQWDGTFGGASPPTFNPLVNSEISGSPDATFTATDAKVWFDEDSLVSGTQGSNMHFSTDLGAGEGKMSFDVPPFTGVQGVDLRVHDMGKKPARSMSFEMIPEDLSPGHDVSIEPLAPLVDLRADLKYLSDCIEITPDLSGMAPDLTIFAADTSFGLSDDYTLDNVTFFGVTKIKVTKQDGQFSHRVNQDGSHGLSLPDSSQVDIHHAGGVTSGVNATIVSYRAALLPQQRAAGSPGTLAGISIRAQGVSRVHLFDLEVVRGGPGDIDGDGVVGIFDFLLVLSEWGICTAPCTYDTNFDLKVGIDEFLEVLANWD